MSLLIWPSKYLPTICLSLSILFLSDFSAAKNSNNNYKQSLTNNKKTAMLYLAVAANFKTTLQQLVNQFLLEHPYLEKKQLAIISGSTGALYAQITQGAPFDIFFAADTARPQQLIKNNFSTNDTFRIYAQGQLAIAFQDKQENTICEKKIQSTTAIKHLLNQLPDSTQPTLAIANPATAPYGKSAKALISRLDETFIQYRIVRGKNILHAQQLLLNNNADLAILSSAQEKHPAMANYQFCILDQSLYPAIEQSMVIIKQTKRNIENERLMTAFADFITSQSAQSIIMANGYLIDE